MKQLLVTTDNVSFLKSPVMTKKNDVINPFVVD